MNAGAAGLGRRLRTAQLRGMPFDERDGRAGPGAAPYGRRPAARPNDGLLRTIGVTYGLLNFAALVVVPIGGLILPTLFLNGAGLLTLGVVVFQLRTARFSGAGMIWFLGFLVVACGVNLKWLAGAVAAY